MSLPFWIEAAGGYLSGLRNGYQRMEGIRVFYYHGVVERKTDPLLERNFNLISEFQCHIRFLRKFGIISLAELVEELSNTRRKLRPAAVITCDDGFVNNMLIGEIANSAHIPWSLFISAGVVGTENGLWSQELALLLLHGETAKVEALDKIWTFKCRRDREFGFRSILSAMKAMPAKLRRETLDNIRQQFPNHETQRLLHNFPSLQTLSWEQIRQLTIAGVEVASHGVDHEIHHTQQEPGTRWRELTESKSELTKRLGRSCAYFAFPNGDFAPTSADEVERAGYTLGFTTHRDTVVKGANPYLLPRLYPPGPSRQIAHEFFWRARG
jgi:peptidoglycan/xylan/chitin deacetylase (PgdA/CDA1 family)